MPEFAANSCFGGSPRRDPLKELGEHTRDPRSEEFAAETSFRGGRDPPEPPRANGGVRPETRDPRSEEFAAETSLRGGRDPPEPPRANGGVPFLSCSDGEHFCNEVSTVSAEAPAP